mmetsp:Transcript_34949/g.84409  ORF Transcript_34949/g.84409 Transcript_34949/m.84409 type:complete len:229 (+) Transcript_34949:2645-3331(+)
MDTDQPGRTSEREEGRDLRQHLATSQLPRPRPHLLQGRSPERLHAQPRQDKGRELLPAENGVCALRQPERVRRARDHGPAVCSERYADGKLVFFHAEHQTTWDGANDPLPEADHGCKRHLQAEHGRLPWMDDQARVQGDAQPLFQHIPHPEGRGGRRRSDPCPPCAIRTDVAEGVEQGDHERKDRRCLRADGEAPLRVGWPPPCSMEGARKGAVRVVWSVGEAQHVVL